jgi:hypothetical protein
MGLPHKEREDYVKDADKRLSQQGTRECNAGIKYADEGEAVNIVSNKNVSRKGAKTQRKDAKKAFKLKSY